jgi:hypothetical protein
MKNRPVIDPYYLVNHYYKNLGDYAYQQNRRLSVVFKWQEILFIIAIILLVIGSIR